ncbi:hypothetical protein, partial [Oscillibacter sp.]|uniref:hypothetical protein n=1 Tax=Oscillibacter sp. TaxID=1945593 RepID=UPI00289E4567
RTQGNFPASARFSGVCLPVTPDATVASPQTCSWGKTDLDAVVAGADELCGDENLIDSKKQAEYDVENIS